ncbi:hypothetical protein [Streptomyces sp. NPDC059076]|uniref:hypothetical protein n=1 Tax=unclassified Streptomyces TaxID=2593676 RepID=UPI0036A7C180
MDRRDELALALLAELQRLASHRGDRAMRLTFRTASGEWVGDILLPESVADGVTGAVRALGDSAGLPPAVSYEEPVSHQLTDTAQTVDYHPVPQDTELDPLLVAALEDMFDAIHPESYLPDVIASESPEAATAAYEQMVTGEWDGEL